MNSVQTNDLTLSAFSPAILPFTSSDKREIYEENRHRVYAIAFWMTDNEIAAEALMVNTFSRAFAQDGSPTAEEIDAALIAELRKEIGLGVLSLNCAPCDKVLSVRRNILRVDLERAVVQLPHTERMIFIMHDVESYEHERIARSLGVTENEARLGLHQARLRMRELLSK